MHASSAIAVPQHVVSTQFVGQGDVIEVFEDCMYREEQTDEYETDSDDRFCVTRTGRTVRSFVRLDM